MSSSNGNIPVLAWPIRSPSNPYTALLYSNMRRIVCVDEFSLGKLAKRYSIWHVHWPDAFLNIRNPLHAVFKVGGFLTSLDYLRARGTGLIWTVHNYCSHEKLHPRLEKWFWRRFIPRVDGIISLSSTGLASVLERFPQLRGIPAIVIPHGHYRTEYPMHTRCVRKTLGIPSESKLILFFGAVRPYKNVEGLVRAFRHVTTANAVLQIAGQPNSVKLAERIMSQASVDARVHVRFEFLQPKMLSAYIGAADLVVLPYREILNSGSALLALSLNRPILVPDRGAMGELKADFGDEWVKTFSTELDAFVLERAISWAFKPRPCVCPMAKKYEWEQISCETANFYRRVFSEIRNR